MTPDDTTVLDGAMTDAIPGPRTGTTEPDAPRRESGRSRRTRPPSEYWDVETASWVTRRPVPGPRRGD